MRHAVVALAVLVALAGEARTRGAEDAPLQGRIVYVHEGALWIVTAAEPRKPRKLAELPPGNAEVRSVRASANGRLLVVDVGGIAGWVQPGDDVRRVAVAPCTGPGWPAPDGRKLLCPGGAETTVVQPAVWKAHEIDVPPREVAFLGPEGKEIMYSDDQGLAAVNAAHPGKPRRLAPHAPTSHLLASPDGTRAVGRYVTADGVIGLYTFQLDGKAAKRKLGQEPLPQAWSPDSTWLLLKDGKLACAARAVGGEYKCWRRFEPLGFSPDSQHVLLAKDGKLYTAPIAGVDAVRPRVVVEDATGVGAWIP